MARKRKLGRKSVKPAPARKELTEVAEVKKEPMDLDEIYKNPTFLNQIDEPPVVSIENEIKTEPENPEDQLNSSDNTDPNPQSKGKRRYGKRKPLDNTLASFKKYYVPKKLLKEKSLDLDDILRLTEKPMVEFFSQMSSNEITRNFAYTCCLIPNECAVSFSSFGNEEKARGQMYEHLLDHLKELLQKRLYDPSFTFRADVVVKDPTATEGSGPKRPGRKAKHTSINNNNSSSSFLFKTIDPNNHDDLSIDEDNTGNNTEAEGDNFEMSEIKLEQVDSDDDNNLQIDILTNDDDLLGLDNEIEDDDIEGNASAADDDDTSKNSKRKKTDEDYEWNSKIPSTSSSLSSANKKKRHSVNLLTQHRILKSKPQTINILKNAFPDKNNINSATSNNTVSSVVKHIKIRQHTANILKNSRHQPPILFKKVDVPPEVSSHKKYLDSRARHICSKTAHPWCTDHSYDFKHRGVTTRKVSASTKDPTMSTSKKLLNCPSEASTSQQAVTGSNPDGCQEVVAVKTEPCNPLSEIEPEQNVTIAHGDDANQNTEIGRKTCTGTENISGIPHITDHEYGLTSDKNEDYNNNDNSSSYAVTFQLDDNFHQHKLVLPIIKVSLNELPDHLGQLPNNAFEMHDDKDEDVELPNLRPSKPPPTLLTGPLPADKLKTQTGILSSQYTEAFQTAVDTINEKEIQTLEKQTTAWTDFQIKRLAMYYIKELRNKKREDVETMLTCKICKNKQFTATATLLYHYRSHAGIKPYVCLICHTTFTRQHSLNYHMLIHNNLNRFSCKECGRMFRHPSHFKEHLRRHTGETPFHCTDCPLKFKTRNTFKRHMRTRHGKTIVSMFTTKTNQLCLSRQQGVSGLVASIKDVVNNINNASNINATNSIGISNNNNNSNVSVINKTLNSIINGNINGTIINGSFIRNATASVNILNSTPQNADLAFKRLLFNQNKPIVIKPDPDQAAPNDKPYIYVKEEPKGAEPMSETANSASTPDDELSFGSEITVGTAAKETNNTTSSKLSLISNNSNPKIKVDTASYTFSTKQHMFSKMATRVLPCPTSITITPVMSKHKVTISGIPRVKEIKKDPETPASTSSPSSSSSSTSLSSLSSSSSSSLPTSSSAAAATSSTTIIQPITITSSTIIRPVTTSSTIIQSIPATIPSSTIIQSIPIKITSSAITQAPPFRLSKPNFQILSCRAIPNPNLSSAMAPARPSNVVILPPPAYGPRKKPTILSSRFVGKIPEPIVIEPDD